MKRIFVCALEIEARPLIDYFKCTFDPLSGKLRVYTNKDADVMVCISGLGEQKMAACLGMLHAWLPSQQMFLYNVGICGSQRFPIGTPVFIHSCTRNADNRSFYPDLLLPSLFQESSLCTVSKPYTSESNPPIASDAVDMEAASFFEVGQWLFGTDRSFSVKVVSDAFTSTKIPKQQVYAWISSFLPALDDYSQRLLLLHKQTFADCLSESDTLFIDTVANKMKLTRHQSDEWKRTYTQSKLYHKEIPEFSFDPPQTKSERTQRFNALLTHYRT